MTLGTYVKNSSFQLTVYSCKQAMVTLVGAVFLTAPANSLEYEIHSASKELIWTDAEASTNITGCGPLVWTIYDLTSGVSVVAATDLKSPLTVYSTDLDDIGVH